MSIQSFGFCDPPGYEKLIYDKERRFEELTIAI